MSAITESPESGGVPPIGPYKPARETAPSVMAEEEPTVARWIGFIGLFLLLVGGASLLLVRMESKRGLGALAGGIFALLGLALLLYHAVRDGDVQIRRSYGFFGYLWLAAGLMLSFWTPTAAAVTPTGVATPPPPAPSSTLFLPYGFGCFVMGLMFLLGFVRHETEISWRKTTVYIIGFGGIVFAGLGLLYGNINTQWLLTNGLLLAVLGLAYLWAFVVLLGSTEDLGYKVGLGIGVVGFLVIVVAIVRSFLPMLFFRWGWTETKPPENFFESIGLLLMLVGFVYTAVAAGLSSDGRFMVLLRRELAAFFYSPLAYIIIFCFAAIASVQFAEFLDFLTTAATPRPIQEPVILYFFGRLLVVPAIAQILVVPLLTMRLLSEEHRSATLEVLLTAPVTDTPVVLSKFLAVLIIYLLTWAPYGLLLLVLRLEGGQAFDYMPLLSFAIILVCSGANYLGMGLFFSSLTRNQVVAGVLTASAMIAVLATYFLTNAAKQHGFNNWATVLGYFSFIDIWLNSLNGRLYMRDVIFQASLAVFWVFLTTKILESRRWR
jgi:ABC-2 type transport system permease protein